MAQTQSPKGSKVLRILGLDPGLRRTGWGVIECNGSNLVYIASGLICSETKDDLAYRLAELYQGVLNVISAYDPCEAAVEETFVNDNPRSTLKLGQARGMALLAPAMKGLHVAEYTPNLIKKTVVGSGHAEKQQVQAMITYLLPRSKFESADEADALAVALCHASHRQIRSLENRVSGRL